MSIIIGIDHGYYAIKTAHCSFAAGLTSYGEHEPYTRQGLLEFGGCFFVCGSGRQPIGIEHSGIVLPILSEPIAAVSQFPIILPDFYKAFYLGVFVVKVGSLLPC